jgi:hypothetical protein
MGRLAGFKYTDVVRKLKRLGFTFDRQAKGSHEPLFPIILAISPKVLLRDPSSGGS